MTVPTAEYLGLLAWALLASAVATDRWWQCRKWHRGVIGDGHCVPWDGQPPATTTEAADAGHEPERAAS